MIALASLSTSLASVPLAPALFGLLMGLCAATAWGLSDFCLRGVSRASAAPVRLLAGTFLAATLALSGALPFARGALAPLARCSLPIYGLAGLLGLLLVLGNLLLYRALAQGPVSLVAPIANSHAAVTVVLALVAGARVALPTLGALTLIGVGVALASLPSSSPSSLSSMSSPPLSHGQLAPSATAAIVISRVSLAMTFSASPARCSFVAARGGVGVGRMEVVGRGPRNDDDRWPAHRLPFPPPLVYRRIWVESAPRIGEAPQQASAWRAQAQRVWGRALLARRTASRPIATASWQRVRRAQPHRSQAIGEALGSAVCLGAVFWAMRFVAPVLGPAATAWMLRADSTLLLWGWMGVRAVLNAWWAAGAREHARDDRHPSSLRNPGWASDSARPARLGTAVIMEGGDTHPKRTPRRNVGAATAATAARAVGGSRSRWRYPSLVATVGLLDALATLAYSFGISATSPLFVAPPAALSAVLTATLGGVVLGEQLGGRRLTGVILALGGTMLLSPLVS